MKSSFQPGIISFLLLFCLVSQNTTYSQSRSVLYDKIYTNEVFGEALGTGGLNSLNYGKILLHKNRFSGIAKVGIGYFPRMIKIIHYRTLSMNVEFKVLYGGPKNQIELGLAHTYIYFFSQYIYAKYGIGSCCEHSFWIVPRLGYRRYFLDGRLFISLAYTPVYEYKIRSDQGIAPLGWDPRWSGIGVGWRF